MLEEKAFEAIEANHPFNGYIATLDSLCAVLELPEDEFYLLLLRTELSRRIEVLRQAVEAMRDPAKRTTSRTLLLLSHAKLTREASHGTTKNN